MGEEVGEVTVIAGQDRRRPPETGLPSWAWVVFAGAGVIALGLATASVVVARRPPR